VLVKVREWISSALASPDLVLEAQPPTQPHSRVVVEHPIRFAGGSNAKVVGPSGRLGSGFSRSVDRARYRTAAFDRATLISGNFRRSVLLMPSPVPEAGRPADPGEEVDQGGVLEAEGAADSRLAGVAVSGAPSGRPRKTVTNSLRDAPDAARKAPEFVVCPLMREIRAFRYFWPCSISTARRSPLCVYQPRGRGRAADAAIPRDTSSRKLINNFNKLLKASGRIRAVRSARIANFKTFGFPASYDRNGRTAQLRREPECRSGPRSARRASVPRSSIGRCAPQRLRARPPPEPNALIFLNWGIH
jgi:hypothetical protein